MSSWSRCVDNGLGGYRRHRMRRAGLMRRRGARRVGPRRGRLVLRGRPALQGRRGGRGPRLRHRQWSRHLGRLQWRRGRSRHHWRALTRIPRTNIHIMFPWYYWRRRHSRPLFLQPAALRRRSGLSRLTRDRSPSHLFGLRST